MGRKKLPTMDPRTSASGEEQLGRGGVSSSVPANAAAAAAAAAASANPLAAFAAAQLLHQAQQSQSGAPSAIRHHQSAGAATASDATRAVDTFQQQLQSIMNSSAATKHMLPNTAPVSSLLPPIISSAAATNHQNGGLSSQVLAILSGAVQSNATSTLLRHPPPTPPSVPAALGLPNMQNMQQLSLDELHRHAQLFQQLKQPVPQTVSLLLADAKRKEEKRNAKRIANRKSASTSRARKKAYVQEMTELNARLKRQALILSLLPDMVIVIGLDGEITFCSAQAEKVLRYGMQELLGVNLSKLLVPASRDKLNRLIKFLVSKKSGHCKSESESEERKREQRPGSQRSTQQVDHAMPEGLSSGAENSASEPGAVVVSEQLSEPSFPLSVVQVEAKKDKTENMKSGSCDYNDNSDGSKQPSSLTESQSSARSASASYPKDGVSAEDVAGGNGEVQRKTPTSRTPPSSSGRAPPAAPKQREMEETFSGEGVTKGQVPSSDLSNSSSLSASGKKIQNGDVDRNTGQFQTSDISNTSSAHFSNVENLQQANTNLERNVRIHNEKMKNESGSKFRDDVTGADVTANNASARLSSLQHRPDSSSEEDSGYRESNDSREETSTSFSDSSGSNGRRKPLAPTWTICLIRKDMSTLWCEVTSSIRTKEPDEDGEESGPGAEKLQTRSEGLSTNEGSSSEPVLKERSDDVPTAGNRQIEVLLCLRPVRDGDRQVDGKLRYDAKMGKKKRQASDSAWAGETSSPSSIPVSSLNRPFKKRGIAEVSEDKTASVKPDSEEKERRDGDAEAAESLMLMTKKTS